MQNWFLFSASNTSYLTDCVNVVVLGFFSPLPEGSVDKDLIWFPSSNPRLNYIDTGFENLFGT